LRVDLYGIHGSRQQQQEKQNSLAHYEPSAAERSPQQEQEQRQKQKQKKQPSSSPPTKHEKDYTEIYIGNLPKHIRDRQLAAFLRQRLETLGACNCDPRCFIRPDRGDAKAEFSIPEHAKMALTELPQSSRVLAGNLLTFQPWLPKSKSDRRSATSTSCDYYGPAAKDDKSQKSHGEQSSVVESKNDSSHYCNPDHHLPELENDNREASKGTSNRLGEDVQDDHHEQSAVTSPETTINTTTNELEVEVVDPKYDDMVAEKEEELAKLREELASMETKHAMEIAKLTKEKETLARELEVVSDRYNKITESLVNQTNSAMEDKQELRKDLEEERQIRRALEAELSILAKQSCCRGSSVKGDTGVKSEMTRAAVSPPRETPTPSKTAPGTSNNNGPRRVSNTIPTTIPNRRGSTSPTLAKPSRRTSCENAEIDYYF